MRALLIFLAITLHTTLFAQTQRWTIPNWDSINNSIIGTDYTPFNITTLEGRQISNASTKGKVVYFSFWFKNCHSCLENFDELNELYNNVKHDTNIVFVAITFDKQEEITDVLEKHEVKFPVACTSRKEVTRLNYGRGFSSMVLVDKNGKVRKLGHYSLTREPANSKLSITIDSATKQINQYNSL